MRSFTWFILIFAGMVGAITAFVLLGTPKAVAVCIGVVGVWIAFGILLSYATGIRRHAITHLGPGWQDAHVVSHSVKTDERVDIQLTLDRLRAAASPKPPVFGVSVGYGRQSMVPLIASNPAPVPIEWETLPRSPTDVQPCAKNALYLLRHEGEPFCALVCKGEDARGREKRRAMLEVMAHPRIAQAALRGLLEQAYENSIYRGKVLSVQAGGRIKFHDLPKVPRDAIVLPAEVMEVLERNVLGLLAHGATLRRAGRSTRHGVLLHGPPGTGKTLATKYLAGACPQYTVLLLTGRHLNLIRETCQLARLLSPSMVVLEDVDLIAADRRRNRHATVLHELLDEMDGLGAKTDCIFLLTTNRPEILEPALAARPGRIDQAIFFPLPDEDCRRRLFAQFGTGLDLVRVDLEPLLGRTEGASPAFIGELFRKAALMAAERGERSQPLPMTGGDFDRALRELLEFGGEITRNLLGYARKAPI